MKKKTPKKTPESDRDGAGITSKQISRRGFLRGMGALSLAAMVPKGMLLAAEEAASPLPSLEREETLLGALYNPYVRPRDWHALARQSPEGMPILGSYSSDGVGGVESQIIWARQMGVGFFLAAFVPGRPTAGLDALFEAARRSDYQVALYIDMAADRPVRASSQARLTAALRDIEARYIQHTSYLRDASRRPVLGVAGMDNEAWLEGALSSHRSGTGWGPVLRFPNSWRWIPEMGSNELLVQAMEHDGLYVGFSSQPQARTAPRQIPVHGSAANAVLISPTRDNESGILLPRISAAPSLPDYVVLDSFNHWGSSVPLEPGTRSRDHYVKQVAAWSRGRSA
jgi:hypothetical protein